MCMCYVLLVVSVDLSRLEVLSIVKSQPRASDIPEAGISLSSPVLYRVFISLVCKRPNSLSLLPKIFFGYYRYLT